MAFQFANNATASLASGITNVATSLTVAIGKGALFPTPAGADNFQCTLVRASDGAIEIVTVTAKSTDTFTITRAQEGTAAIAFVAGDKFELRVTKSVLDALVQKDGSGNATIGGTMTAASFSGAGTGLTGTASSLTAGAVTNGVYTTSSVLVDKGTVADTALDTATTTGIYLTTYTGFSRNMLVWNVSGSTGPTQMEVGYGNTGPIRIRNKTDSTTWSSWRTFLTDYNYNSYAPTLTGGGASGSWAISVTGSSASCSGNAATVTNGVYTTGDQTIGGNKTFSGALSFSGGTTLAANGDLTVRRSSGTTGVVYFVDGTKYLYYDGANYTLQGGSLTCSGNVSAYSDERLKTNWRDLPADFIEQLSGVKTGVYDRVDSSETQVGVSAQSLQSVLPNAVMQDAGGTLAVAYGNAALAACVMLAREVEALKAEIKAMKESMA